MNLKRLTIGQMAQLNHISQQSLRLYDKEGLLKPQIVDPENGYRYYHILQSSRLDLIQNLKKCNLTLKQIKALLDNEDSSLIWKKLHEQTHVINKQIQEMTNIQKAINRILDNYKRYQSLPKNGEIFLEYIPERTIVRLELDIDFFQQDETGYEYMLRQLKDYIIQYNIPLSLFTNIGTIIKKEDLRLHHICANEVFFLADESFDNKTRLPSATYVCMCFEDYSNEADNVEKLLQYIEKMNYKIIGDYLCEVIVDFPISNDESRRVFSKIQIPVLF